jgi:hypothetical protein
MVQTLSNLFRSQNIKFNYKKHVRCLNHIMNLTIQSLFNYNNKEINKIDKISEKIPPPQPKRRISIDRSMRCPEERRGRSKNKTKGNNNYNNNNNNNNNNSNFTPDILETLKRLRIIVSNIRSSTKKYYIFRAICEESGQQIHVINSDVPTRWNSTFKMIDRAITLRLPISNYCFNEGIISLHSREWEELSRLLPLLSTVSRYSDYCEGEAYPTMHMALAIYNKLFDSLEDTKEEIPYLAPAIDIAWRKLKKYYEFTDQNPCYYISLILNPMLKTKYMEEGWSEEGINSAKLMFVILLIS